MNEIEQLIEKYLDGDTTHAEELQLRQYFARQQEIPDEWQPYRALFAYIDQQQPKARTVSMPRRTLRWTAVAAVAAGLVTLAVTWPRTDNAYAVIDGQRTTDIDVVMSEAELALQMVAANDDETFDALLFMN